MHESLKPTRGWSPSSNYQHALSNARGTFGGLGGKKRSTGATSRANKSIMKASTVAEFNDFIRFAPADLKEEAAEDGLRSLD